MKYTLQGILCLMALHPIFAICQSGDTSIQHSNISQKLSDKYIRAIDSRSADVQSKMQEGTEKYLDKLKANELILQKQLSKIDLAAADKVFEGSQKLYDNLQNDVKNNSENILKSYGKYVPGIDSAITSLKFLQQNGNITDKFGTNASQVKAALSKVQALEDQFKKTDNVEEFIKQREIYLKQQLSSYNLPGLQQYNQQAAYYAQTMSELKQDWEDPTRLEQKAVTILNKMPAFQDFMKKNSMIAGLFNLPEDYSTSGLGGLQTKDQVQKTMQQQMVMMGPNGGQTAEKNIADAQSTMTSLRDKLNKGSSELAMPAGNTNDQHTKSLFKRLEYGVNVQNSRANGFFPTTTYFAGTVGYRVNNKSTVGIGISYNVGWGNDIQHIHISNQGMGLRSFLNIQLKGSFFATGGYERNYNKISSSVNQICSGYLWQESGLIGISKIISLRGKLVKKTQVQLLWDMLSYSQKPKTQPFVFRLGYNF